MIALRLRTRLTIWFAASILLILAPFLTGVAALEWWSMRAALDHHLNEDLEVAMEMLVVRGADVMWRTEATRDLGYDAGEQRWSGLRHRSAAVLRPRPPGRQQARTPDALTQTAGALHQTPAGAHVHTLTARRMLGPTPVAPRGAHGRRSSARFSLRLWYSR